ncbi:MAG: threonine/serine dehydratase [Gammaproteobacteria bacterium]|nr:threonine/serine dehydratase [Gammaproteobacteria bacterium]
MNVTLPTIEQAAARLQGVAVRTPLLQSAELDARTGARVLLKAENLQHIGAFKFRGAFNRLCQLNEQVRARGVVAFSSGNHAQGVAFAAKRLNIPANIVMPDDAPMIKLEGTRRLGASVRLYRRHHESREQIAAELAEKTGAALVPAFDDPFIINGQGTVGLELMEQSQILARRPDILLVPCGGGGLLAGVATAINGINQQTAVYGVEPETYDDHWQSHRAGKRVKIDGTTPTLCDALMATSPGELTWSINHELVSDYLRVSEDEVRHAISFAFRYLKLVVEPGGAVALAALLQGKLAFSGKICSLIISGGNIDASVFAECLNRFPEP